MSNVSALITAAAPGYGVPPSLALAVAQHESGLNQAAVGGKGEIGVFQLLPSTAAGLHVDPTDVDQNIAGGLSYLQSLYSQFGNWTDALEAYNGGPSHVVAGNVSTAAQGYAAAILAASGVSDGSTDENSAISSPVSPSFDLSDTLDAAGLTALSGGAVAALAVILALGVVWFAMRR